MPKIITQEEILYLFGETHNHKYDYSSVKYKSMREEITIICPIHGSFSQVAGSHRRGHGCPKCAQDMKSNVLRADIKDVINGFKEIHGNRYNYDKVKYISNIEKVIISCSIHGDFLQSPINHRNGEGCPKCNLGHGWSEKNFINVSKSNGVDNDCILYIIKCFDDNEKFYKIGITSKSIEERFQSRSRLPYSYEVIKEVFGRAKDIFNLEKKLHKKHREAGLKYNLPKKHFCGYSECFTNLIWEII